MTVTYTPGLEITPQGTLLRIEQKLPSLVGGTGPGDEGSLPTTGNAGSPQHSWTRPADTTAYTANDVVGSATTANHHATPAGGSGSLIQIQSAELIINVTSVPSGMAGFRLHFWDSEPTAIADNAPHAVAAADRIKYCGRADLGTPAVVGGGFLCALADYVGRPIRLLEDGFYFQLQTLGGYTPASATEYRVRFHAVELGA